MPKAIRKLPLHANGHQVVPSGLPDEVEVFDFSEVPAMQEIPPYVSCGSIFACGWCGAYPKMRVDGDAVHIDEPCPAAGGITTVIRLEVPSGKIIVADDLRGVYDGFDHDGFASYNSALGQHQVIEAMAELGCAFGPVGNSCPSLWKTGEDTYQIARMPQDDEDEYAPVPEGSERLAGIITDLWAYSIADYGDWLAKGGAPVEELGWTVSVVEIPAGTYEFTHHSGERDFDDDADHVVWADIKKVA